MRVNLLRKSEIRYQGAVTKRFMIVAPLVTLCLIVIIAVPIFVMNITSTKSRMRQLTADIEQMQIRADATKEKEKNFRLNNETLKQLVAWRQQSQEIGGLLVRLQSLTPETVQFRHLIYRVVLGEPMADSPASWIANLQLVSQVEAALPEDIVLRFLNKLSHDPSLKEYFDSMTLVSFTRQKSEKNVEMAEFHITGKGLLAQ